MPASSKMLAYISLPNLTTLLNRQCHPRYSRAKNLVTLDNRIRFMDLYDYYRYRGDRTNMIMYLRDGFDRCVLYIKHIEMCCYNGLLFEALPTTITKEHARYMANMLSPTTDGSSQFRILLGIMWIYADTHTKGIIERNIGESFPLPLTHGRTLVEQLKLYNSKQICKLGWTLYDIYDINWGIDYGLVDILSKSLTESNRVMREYIQLISDGISVDPEYVYTPQEYEILIACGHYSADQIIDRYRKSHCNIRGEYSHEFIAMTLCCADKSNIIDNCLQDFVLDDCEYCKRISI